MLRRSGIAIAAAFFCSHPSDWARTTASTSAWAGRRCSASSPRATARCLLRRTPARSWSPGGTGFRNTARSRSTIPTPQTRRSTLPPPLTYRIQSTTGEYSGAYVFSFHQSDKSRAVRFCGRGARWFFIPATMPTTINGVQTYHSGVPANQAGLPLWRRIRLAHLFQPAPDSPVFPVQPPGPAPAVPRAGLQGARLQNPEPVHRGPGPHGGAFGRDRGEILERPRIYADSHG